MHCRHSIANDLVIMVMLRSILEAAAEKSLSRRTSKDSLDTTKSPPYLLLRILNFRPKSPSVSSRIACDDSQAREFAEETWNQIVLPVHLQVDHNISKDFPLHSAQIFLTYIIFFFPK